jgi:peptidase M48-like protein
VRLWGYDLKTVRPEQELTTITIGDDAVRDSSEQPQQLSPALSQRLWEQQAEDNVVERLSKAGLMAPSGEVDDVLLTVVRNLQITNNVTIEPPVKTRVLLTSPLDSMAIGRTIALSRGLIDVLPDEASLAMVLAHELAHIALGHRVIDTKFSFADKLMVPDDELLATVQYRHEMKEELEADAKALEYLKNSPYKEKLGDAGLFLKAITENARKLKSLIQPHVAAHIGDSAHLSRMNELIAQAPTLAPERLDQVAALTLGARIIVDPWSGRLELLKAASVPLASAREKASLAVTPLVPYLRYSDAKPGEGKAARQ